MDFLIGLAIGGAIGALAVGLACAAKHGDQGGGKTVRFELDEKQARAAAEFRSTHPCPLKDVGAIGGKYTYEFTPTTVATAAVLKCGCGAKIDLSDYENW